MIDDRKNKIGKIFLLQNKTPKKDLEKLDIQEIVFLIYSAKYFNNMGEIHNIDFDNKIKVFFDVLHEKIKYAEELYIAYDVDTNYPLLDYEGKVWMFSKKEYAKNAKEYYLKNFISLEMKFIDKKNIIAQFADLYRLGIENILIDNGEYAVEVHRGNILAPPDYRNTPKINIPVVNPKLQYVMLRFFQKFCSKNNYENKELYLHKLQSEMIYQIVKAKYLVPIKINEQEKTTQDSQGIKPMKKGTIMALGILTDDYKQNWLSAFTDWEEFEKVYDKNVWSGNIASYNDLCNMSEKIKGIVINCNGVNLQIDDKYKKLIENHRNIQ